MTNRRDFMLGGLSAGAAVPLLGGATPGWLQAAGANASASDTLVVLQIRGGWDWLNLLVNPDDPTYKAARPSIAIPRSGLLSIPNSNLGWNAHLTGIRDLYNAGKVAVIQNIGYPSPNLSHFTSEQKWAAADPSVRKHATGWLSTWLTKGYSGGFQIPALQIGTSPNAFSGSRVPRTTSTTALNLSFDSGTAVDSKLEKLAMLANSMVPRPGADAGLLGAADALRGAIQDSEILKIAGSGYTPKATYPTGALGRYLSLTARFVVGRLPTSVYYLSTGGFDTHSNEESRFDTLLPPLSAAIKAFFDDLRAQSRSQKVTMMIFSEFGRRLGENGSAGTDHGHGGMAMIIGDDVKGGLYGKWPDLSIYKAPFTRKYIRFNADSTDFRHMYGEVLDKVLQVPQEKVLGQRFPAIGFM